MPGNKFEQLLNMMKYLRGPKGCLWDKEQTPQSFVKHVGEETEEVLHAVEADDMDELEEELGDLLWNIVFMCQMAEEKGLFTVKSVMEGVRKKIIRRHPHVFGKVKVKNVKDIKRLYIQIKKAEKKAQQQEKKNNPRKKGRKNRKLK